MIARVIIKTKPSVLSPEASAIQKCLVNVGCDDVEEISLGKIIDIKISKKDEKRTLEQIEKATKEFLANKVTENYKIEIIK